MINDIEVRKIEQGDAEAILAIRNLPSVYKYFRNPKKVTSKKHNQWFVTQLRPEKRRNFFVAVKGSKILGYLRYDDAGEIYDISIAIAPEFQKKGIGSVLLRQTLPKIGKDGKRIQAEVQKENLASRGFFEKHGFRRIGEKGNSIILARIRPNVLISGAGGSPFPYIFTALGEKYNLISVDANPAIKFSYPEQRIVTVPFATDKHYPSVIESLVKKYRIEYYIPLIDQEVILALALAGKYNDLKVIAPNREFTDLCLDKYRLAKRLSKLHISEVKTWQGDEFTGREFPVFIKPKTGTGSRGGYKIDSKKQLSAYYHFVSYRPRDVIIQEYIDGEEYTVSVVVNHQNRLMAIVPKRIILKKGITIHAVTQKNKLIEAVCQKIIEKLQPAGPFNVQLGVKKERVKIFEINPRFSTTSILTCEAGVNEFDLCMDNYDSKSVKYIDNWKQGLHLFRRWESCFYESL